MTPKEHALMLGVLVTQLQLMRALIEMLNSRGIIETGDMGAFMALVQSQKAETSSLVDAAHELYLAAAKTVGVETGLEF
jgi:hypothetical protein